MFRVTNSHLLTRLTGNLNRRLGDISKLSNQLATGKKINKAGDDPITANRIMAFKHALSETKQFSRNAEDAVSWLQSTDLALGDALDVMQRVRGLALVGGGITDDESRQAVAEELDQLREHLLSVANTSFDGDRYLFAGNALTQQPFTLDADGSGVYAGDDKDYKYEIVQGSRAAINITGQKAFMEPDLFSVITDVRQAVLNANDIDSVLTQVDDAVDGIIQQRSVCGARMNRFEMTLERYADEELNFTSLLSSSEEIDLAQVLVEYTMKENTYHAALSTTARALQPTLLDYIR